MDCKVILAPQAIADLEQIVRRIAKDDPETARRVGNNLIDRVAILEKFPLIGSAYAGRRDVRKLVSWPYLIFYRVRVEEAVVDVLRYWHGSRGSAPEFYE
jgi:addiction module RelE/StbE family toxin